MTAFHRGGLQKLAPGSPPEEQSSSFFSSSSKAEVLGQRKTQGQSPRTPPLSTSLMGNTSQQLSHCCPPASLADGRRDGELVPRLWWQGRLAASCRHAAPDAWLASRQPSSSMDPNHPVPKSQLCRRCPCLDPPSHSINNRLIRALQCVHSPCASGLLSASQALFH